MGDSGVDPINSTSLLSPSQGVAATDSFADLGSEDFLKLLILQLRNQDPLEPLGNEELLRQISSIRDIELSTTLTESLQTLTGQQHFASASALIGQYVTGVPGQGEEVQSGLVAGVRFTGQGLAILQLANGGEIPLDRVHAVEPPETAAEALIGQRVVGLDRRDAANPQVVEGVVTQVRIDGPGNVYLELDTGEDLRFRDLLSVTAAETI